MHYSNVNEPVRQQNAVGVDGTPAPVLPTDAQARKNAPVFRGLLRYFPKACAAVASSQLLKVTGGDTLVGAQLTGRYCDVALLALAQLETELGFPVALARDVYGTGLMSGLLQRFPRACLAVAELSRVGNEQHNPGQPMHWAREKSTDHGDCIVRHQMEAGTLDTDGQRHSTKVAWRALAQLELELEAEANAASNAIADAVLIAFAGTPVELKREPTWSEPRKLTEADVGKRVRFVSSPRDYVDTRRINEIGVTQAVLERIDLGSIACRFKTEQHDWHADALAEVFE